MTDFAIMIPHSISHKHLRMLWFTGSARSERKADAKVYQSRTNAEEEVARLKKARDLLYFDARVVPFYNP